MKDKVILGIKGFFMGIANIIPGVSGGTLAITMGIYEDIINAISHFVTKIKDNIKFLLPILIGASISIVIGSKVIGYSLENHPLPTIMFFTGLILGGMPMLYKKVKNDIKVSNLIIFALTFMFVIGIAFLKTGGEVSFASMNVIDYIKLFLVGMVASATMIIPGISGSFMLMVMGYYEPIINTINSLTSFNNIVKDMSILVPFGIGVLVGIIIIAKIIEFLFKKFEVPTYFGIIGFVLASIIGIFTSAEGLTFSIVPFILGVILFVAGLLIAYKLGDE